MKRATKKLVGDLDYTIISIHALVKRATPQYKGVLEEFIISIHALVKRATYSDYIHNKYTRHFNPRPREEGDGVKKTFQNLNYISIHALVKRATAFATEITVMLTISIHALVKRATKKYVMN